MMIDMLPPPAPGPGGRRGGSTGNARRKELNSLPCMFVLYVAELCSIVGAAVIVRALKTHEAADAVTWHFTRGVRLVTPFALEVPARPRRFSIFRCRPQEEALLRVAASGAGSILGEHFPEFTRKPFRAFTVPMDFAYTLCNDPAQTLAHSGTSGEAHQAGVQPDICNSSVASRPGGVGQDDSDSDDGGDVEESRVEPPATGSGAANAGPVAVDRRFC